MSQAARVCGLALLAGLTACARSFVTQAHEGERVVLAQASTMGQVRSVLGPPSEVRGGAGGAVIWLYHADGITPARVLQFRGTRLEWLKHVEPGS